MTYQASNQSIKKTNFTVDLLWWGSLKFAPSNLMQIFKFDADSDGTQTNFGIAVNLTNKVIQFHYTIKTKFILLFQLIVTFMHVVFAIN